MDDRSDDTPKEGFVLRVSRIGDATGFILPDELIARMGVKEGDRLVAVEQAAGALKVSARDAKRDRGAAIMDELIVEYADTLRALAK